jgi:hypothetical protein
VSARVKTELWVQAFLRSCDVAGMFGAVLHRGNAEAGSLLVVINHLNATHTLLGTPPGPAYDDNGERRFENLTPIPLPWRDVQTKITRIKSFDSDLWVIEVEDRNGLAGIVPEKSD